MNCLFNFQVHYEATDQGRQIDWWLNITDKSKIFKK